MQVANVNLPFDSTTTQICGVLGSTAVERIVNPHGRIFTTDETFQK